jgi:hypothetical protein
MICARSDVMRCMGLVHIKGSHVVKENSTDRRERLLSLRAQRLGIDRAASDASAPKKAASHSAASRAAKRLDSSAASVLAQDLKRLARIEYPTDECLTAADVDEWVRNSVHPESLLAHIENCAACEALVKALSPSPEKAAEFKRAATGEFVAV